MQYVCYSTGWKIKVFFFYLSFFWAGRSPARPGIRAWSAAARFCAALAAWRHPARTDLQQRWLPVYGITKMFGVISVAGIRIRRIHIFLGLLDDSDPEPISQRYGSGSLNHRKTLIPTVLWLLFDFRYGITKMFSVNSVADPDPSDPYVFGPPGWSEPASISQRYGSRILLSSSKNRKKNLDSYSFVTSFWLLIFEKWWIRNTGCNIRKTFKKYEEVIFCF